MTRARLQVNKIDMTQTWLVTMDNAVLVDGQESVEVDRFEGLWGQSLLAANSNNCKI